MRRDPSLDDLIDSEATGAERERLQHVHELLLEAGPPPELSPALESGPTLGASLPRRRRRVVKQRALLLLAATLALLLIFLGGYAVGNGRNSSTDAAVVSLELRGTSVVPDARASLEVLHRHGGNWPMTLTAVGLPKLPAHHYYEVYLVRDGRIGGSCGTFNVASTGGVVKVTLNSPYRLRKGDTWLVTRPGAGGVEPGPTVLRPVTA